MSAVTDLKPFLFDEDEDREIDLQFELPQITQLHPVTPYTDDLDDEYQAAQDKLRELRQQEEQIKRQAAELEELTKKEQLFKSGRIEVCEELNRFLSLLDREASEAQRLAEECGSAHERLESHLASINALRPEMWSRADRKSELSRALNCIEDAEDAIDSVQALIDSFGKKPGLFGGFASSLPLPGGSSFASQQGDFFYWLKSGFAFSLPFVGFGILAFIAFLLF